MFLRITSVSFSPKQANVLPNRISEIDVPLFLAIDRFFFFLVVTRAVRTTKNGGLFFVVNDVWLIGWRAKRIRIVLTPQFG